MALVRITVNGRSHDVVCDDGDEDRIARLGRRIDERVAELVDQLGDVGYSRLVVLAALLMAAELDEAEAALRRADLSHGEERAELAEFFAAAAARLEELAARLGVAAPAAD